MKIPFDIKYRPQIESGEYKVETHEGKPVRIICWDRAPKVGDDIYLTLCVLIPQDNGEAVYYYNQSGKSRSGERYDLCIITPEPELSEFEKRLWEIMKSEGSPIGSMDKFKPDDERVFHDYSNQLLELAKKELQEKVIHDYWKQAADRCVQAREEGRAEALKDLPRWKKAAASFGNYTVAPTDTGQLCLLIDGYYIMLSDLKKLPGINE